MITAIFLGLTGSLHCAGMCGPLVLMTPVVGDTPLDFLLSRVTYHFGRLATYLLIGAIFGLVGESIVFAGLQRWLSISVGLIMIVAICAAASLSRGLNRTPAFIKSLFGSFLRRRSFTAIFALGATNGLLPCGLVYMAATASIAAGSMEQSILYMFFFGLGTLPMLLTISIAGKRFQGAAVLQKVVPISVVVVALLLIIRAQPFSLVRESESPNNCAACATAQNR